MARSTPAQKPRGLASSSSMFFPREAIPDQQCRAAGDGGICQVECRKVVGVPMEVEEIHHVSIRDAVNQVADCPAEDECQREAEQLLRLVLAQQPDYPHRRDDG